MTLGNGKATFIAAMFGLLFVAISSQYGDSIDQFLGTKDQQQIYLEAAKNAGENELFRLDIASLSLEADGEDLATTNINGSKYEILQFSNLSDLSIIGRAEEAYLYTTPLVADASAGKVYALCFRSKQDAVCTPATEIAK